MSIKNEIAYIEGYVFAIDEILNEISLNEAYEGLHERLRQNKIKPIKDKLNKLAIKYKNNQDIDNSIQIISKWASTNKLAISIQTYGALSYLLKMSFKDDEILLTLASILTLSMPLSAISKEIVEYAKNIEQKYYDK